MADIFDRVRQGIDKGITTITARSKELLESSKLNSQIRTLKDRKKAALEELGNIVYVMFVKGDLDAERIRAKASAIAELDNQIKGAEEELRRVFEETQHTLGIGKISARCDCGAEISEGAKFCRQCGRKVA